jgi:steroid 5-alpha reductase family enzyme
VSPWIALAALYAAMVVVMALGWAWQQRQRNAGIVDALWAAGLAGGAVWIAATGHGAPWPRAALALCGGAWGLRLARHLWRRVHGEAEDGRYRALRERWQGSGAKFFAFFQFQALLVPLFALPFVAVAANPVDVPTPWLVLGIATWLGAVAGEAQADAQLARFRADPANRGRTCRDGWWRYSRHPNYFFEWLHWFAYVALAVGSPLAWLAWGGPLLMYVFLRWLSGVPFTEQQALRTRGDDYRAYQRDTPMFFPWFPKRPAP